MTAFGKLGLLAGLVTVLLSAPATAAEKNFGLTSFDAIVLNGDFAVEVVTKSPVSAVATGSASALDAVSIEAADGTLTISQRRFAGDERRSGSGDPVHIRVNAAILRQATVTGAGSLSIDQMQGATVQLGMRGPGRLSVGRLTADRLSAVQIGNGTLLVGGKVKKANFVASGTGVIAADGLAATDLIVDSEGGGDQRFNALGTATITARGLGRTVVSGKAACTIRNAGSGSVLCGAAR